MKQTTLFKSNLSHLRKIHRFCTEYDLDFREVVEAIIEGKVDFEVDNYRFIHEDDIDEIQQQELEGDRYILGCFNAWFIADNTDLSLAIVEALQKGEQYEEIGNHIVDNGYLEVIQQDYSSADGYGQHFAGYDHETIEDLLPYYVFRTN